MRPFPLIAFSVLLAALAGCTGRAKVVAVAPPSPHLVSIQIEAYDPVTNQVWVGLSVRVVEGWMEWSDLTIENPDPQAWSLTGGFGTVLFTENDLADARIGFVEDEFGRAILESGLAEDEAIVLVELAAPGSPSVFVDIDLTWESSDVFVSIPFEL